MNSTMGTVPVIFPLRRSMTARKLFYAAVCVVLARNLPFLVLVPSETHNDATIDSQIATIESRQMLPPMLQEYTDKKERTTVLPTTNNQVNILSNIVSLEYIHITKTGGSAIEEAAARESLTWGLCHFERRPSYGPGCRRPTFGWPLKPPKIHSEIIPLFAGELWHTPPTWFVNPNPYHGAATFTIVRNPYDRIVSEYYCTFFGAHRREHVIAPSTASIMTTRHAIAARNETTRESQHWGPKSSQTTRKYQSRTKNNNNRLQRDNTPVNNREASEQQQGPSHGWPTREDQNPGSAQKYATNNESHGRRLLRLKMKRPRQQVTQQNVNTMEDTPETLNTWVQAQLQYVNFNTGHMLPQYHYCFNKDKQQTITHILRYENLQNEFASLMKQYKLKVRLPEQRITTGHDSERKGPRMTKNDLRPATIKMINKHMENDFLWLGYDMIDAW